ncbi:MAG: terminase [Verrucomicrobiaceae bacterium]|nr:MAG: terminase [Verrucomicrobiaceae bacterium]RPJ34183.1 MAG: terminase [Verrucomicrobiaceae bacterium]
MQKPLYSSDEEMMLMTRLWSPKVKDDPEAFVLFCFPWGQPNTPLAKFSGPRKWQREVLRSIGDHIKANDGKLQMDTLRQAVSSGRGIGKSALVSWLILWMMTTRIGATVIVSANSEAQLRSVTWGELSKWAAMAINAHWWEISATKLLPAQWITELVERDLKKGARYWAAEGKLWSEENPDSYAGVHNHDGMMLIFDEASGIPDAIWSVGAGFFTENILDRYWFAFSNPRRNTGYFFECFNSKRNFWKTRNIDARTVEGTDIQVYEQIIAEYGEDSSQARIEVYGEFPSAGEDQFISPVLVDEAQARPRYQDTSAPIIVGVDPARSGADSTVILARQGRDIISIKRYQGEDTMTIVGRVIEAIEEFRPALTVIDEGGLGYGILDRLTEQRYKVRGVNFGWKSSKPIMWGNRRAEMWGAMREWLRTASIPTDRQLKSDLIGPTKKPDSKGTIFLEGKKEMKARGLASPDAADALAVTFAFPVAHKEYADKNTPRTYQGNSVINSWMGA